MMEATHPHPHSHHHQRRNGTVSPSNRSSMRSKERRKSPRSRRRIDQGTLHGIAIVSNKEDHDDVDLQPSSSSSPAGSKRRTTRRRRRNNHDRRQDQSLGSSHHQQDSHDHHQHNNDINNNNHSPDRRPEPGTPTTTTTTNMDPSTTTVPLHRQSPSKYKYHTPIKSKKKKKRGRLLKLVQDDVIGALTMQDQLCKQGGVNEPPEITRCGVVKADDLSTASTSRSSGSGSPSNRQQSSDSISIITTIDSDKELELHARQIRLELRQAEMQELLEEAERAAASGQKSFAGRTSTFGIDDPELELPPGGFKPKSTPISQQLVRRSLQFGSPLGRRILPDNFNKISVKALRDVAEVVPNFKDFHMHLRTHFMRRKVSETSLFFQEVAPNAVVTNTATSTSQDMEGGSLLGGVKTNANEQTSMQLWNTFASLSSWQSGTLSNTKKDTEGNVQQKAADSVTESPPTQQLTSESSNGSTIGDVLAEHKQTKGSPGYRSHVELLPGLGLHAALKLQEHGSTKRKTDRRRGSHQNAGEVRSCPTTPERGILDPTVVDADPLPKALSDGQPWTHSDDDVPGSPTSPIVLDDVDITDISFTPDQGQNRIYQGPSPPPGLPLTPKEDFREVFNATFATPGETSIRARLDSGILNRYSNSNRGNLVPDFITPVRLRDIRDDNLKAWPSDAFILDDAMASSDKQGAGQPVREESRRVHNKQVIDLQHLEGYNADTPEQHPGFRSSRNPQFMYNSIYEMQATSDSGIVENISLSNGGNPDSYVRNLMKNLDASPRTTSAATEIIDVEVLRKGHDLALLDDTNLIVEGDHNFHRSARAKLFSESGVASPPARQEIIAIDDYQDDSMGRHDAVNTTDNVQPCPDRKGGGERSVADESKCADQSKATADFPCECMISPASSLESDAEGAGGGGGTSAWNILEQASGESKRKSLQAAVAMLSAISPSGPMDSSDNNALLSSKENDEFMSNYLYCSKTSEPPPEPSPPTSTPICSGTVPCQETRMPCGEIALDSCVGSFFDAALKFLPIRKSTEGSKFLSLSLSRESKTADSKRSSFSWYDMANERFDHLLDGIMGGVHRKGDHCRLSFQAPALKERKTPQSRGITYENVSGEYRYDEDLGGVIYVKRSTSTSSPPRAKTSEGDK